MFSISKSLKASFIALLFIAHYYIKNAIFFEAYEIPNLCLKRVGNVVDFDGFCVFFMRKCVDFSVVFERILVKVGRFLPILTSK